MDKKIEALKAAYASKDAVKVRNAARALLAHDRKHPFAICTNPEAAPIVALAARICAAPSIQL